MKYNNLSMIFGILFAIGLGVITYLNTFVAIVLALRGVEKYITVVNFLAMLAITVLVCAFFARKKMIKLFEDDSVHIMGSDLHDDKKRNYDGFIKASTKLPRDMLKKIYDNSAAILSNGTLKR